MKVAVIGCGAIGLNYGLRLLESAIFGNKNVEVFLILRRDFSLVCEEGILAEFVEESRMFTASTLDGNVFNCTSNLARHKGHMDWVIVCCKSYSINEDLRQSLLPLNAPNTKFLVIMNGIGVEDTFIEWFGSDKVYGALSFIACNRGPNPPLHNGPLILHVYSDYSLEIGHAADNPDKLKLALDLFSQTSIESKVSLTYNLVKSRWTKLCWNLAFAGISVAMGGLTTDVICSDPSLRLLANNILADAVRVGNADILRQHKQRHSNNDEIPICTDILDEKTIKEMIWARTDCAGPYKMSTAIDLSEGREMEVKYMFDEPLRRARSLCDSKASVNEPVLSYPANSSSVTITTSAVAMTEPLHYTSMESVILMVQSMSRISAMKIACKKPWEPTLFTA